MMNKDKYKKAFSNVSPSDEAIERIFDMTKEKKKMGFAKKGLIAVVVALVVMLCGSLSVNAATNGALFEGLTLIINGEDVNMMDYLKKHEEGIDENGNEYEMYEFELSDGEDSDIKVKEFTFTEDENGDVSYETKTPETTTAQTD